LDVLQPLGLDVSPFLDEELEVHFVEFVFDLLLEQLEFFGVLLHDFLLVTEEHTQLIALLLDLDQTRAGNLLEGLFNLAILHLKQFDQVKLEAALFSAVDDEGVLAVVPVVLLETKVVGLVKGCQVLVKEPALAIVN